jgi:hypothetical protein
MQSAAQYRVYAEECRKLAKTLKPENRETLLKIAEAWERCAADMEAASDRADRRENKRW